MEGTDPCLGIVNPGISSESSLYMFRREGGTRTPFRTENAKPWMMFSCEICC
jgi:hypothetical protein